MVQSEQRGLTRQQSTCGWRGRGSAKRSGFGALAVVALLVVVIIVSTTGCGSNTQASASTTASISATGQTGTGQSLPSGAPSGAPSGTPPLGGPGGPTSSTDTSGATTTTTAAAVTDSTTTTEAATTTTSLASGQHGDGIYRAGTDINTGLYRGTVVGTKGQWEISSDANGDRYVAGDEPTGQFYVKVTSGQYLRISGVIIEKAGSTAADPLATSALANGTYRAGYDIEVGWYDGTVTGDGLGYWQISSDANGQTLVANDYPLGSFTVKVKSGQYLTLRGVTVSLQQ
jgi:hypothetical protein